MTRRTSEHNEFFLLNFQNLEIARSFFQNYLPPALIAQANWNNLRLAPSDFTQKALRHRNLFFERTLWPMLEKMSRQERGLEVETVLYFIYQKKRQIFKKRRWWKPYRTNGRFMDQ